MSQLEIVDSVVDKSLLNIGEDFKYKVDCHKIFFKWRELVGDDANEIFPVQISGSTLTLYSENSPLKDKFKYRIPQLIAKINSICGAKLVTKIIFGNNFSGKRKIVTERKNLSPLEFAEVTLTEDEISECEKKAAAIQNPALNKMLLTCLLAKKKADKAKKISGWHKCLMCENLCSPENFLCDVCQIRESNKLFQAIRKIFFDAPATKFVDVQKKISQILPHMKSQCTFPIIESARMSLISQTANRLSVNDKESQLAKFFVMLVRQLPEESLTEKIIERTLHEFRFDLVDRPPFKPQNFKKFNSSAKVVIS